MDSVMALEALAIFDGAWSIQPMSHLRPRGICAQMTVVIAGDRAR
jgi:hypothetical protein